jgi:hypothetical protein
MTRYRSHMTNTHHHQRPNLKPTHSLNTDRLGGARFSERRATRVRLQETELRHLEVIDAECLRELDLSGCAPGIDVTISGSPLLERVVLPDHGHGALVHFDCGAYPPHVELLGRIRRLDARWQGGEFQATSRRNRAPYENACIGIAPTVTIADDTFELLVLHGDEIGCSTIDLETPKLRHLVVRNIDELMCITLKDATALEEIAVAGCTDLSELEADHPIGRLELAGCRHLSQVNADGQILRLRDCGSAGSRLSLAGAWHQVSLQNVETSFVDAPRTQRLVVANSAAIQCARLAAYAAVTIRGETGLIVDDPGVLRLDGASVAALLGRAMAGESIAERQLVDWCRSRYDRRDAFDTLRALARYAAEHPEADPRVLWRLRCRLHAAANRNRAARDDDSASLALARKCWHWRLPRALEQEGWNADLQLWIASAGWHIAAMCARSLVESANIVALAALADLAKRTPRPALKRLLRRAMRHYAVNPDAQRLNHLHSQQALQRLAQSLIAIGDAELAEGFIDHVLPHAGFSVQIELLGRLGAAGHAPARAALLALSAHRDADADMRGQALARAFAPLRTQRFEQEADDAQ